jgi:tetratricopeptide (TPR) repeat protein
MKCPICDRARQGEELRCPGCGERLTRWVNFDDFGRQAHRAGLDAVNRGELAAAAELFLRAVAFAPQEAVYLGAYGRLLAQMGRYAEAALVLGHAHELAPTPESRAAKEKAEELASRGPGD